MNINLHGRKIHSFCTSEGCTIHDPAMTGSGAGAGLRLSATYHGDRDEFWVVVHDSQGRETQRYNAKTLHSIRWEEPIEADDTP